MKESNIKWYEDKELAIFFNHKPNTNMLEPLPSMSQAEKDIIEKYPFINCTTLKVALFDRLKGKVYKFTIPKGFKWDGATIGRCLWWIIGAKTNPKFRTPSLIHDFCCSNKYAIDFDRNFSSRVFKALLKVAGVKKWRRNIMYFFVDLWQRTQGWSNDTKS
jgi:hypothetical protein